jgi:two-component system cell cycle response regulator DivK
VHRALVLIVDDILDNREMYMDYLRYVGFSVAGAATGEEAVGRARELGPAVILMDLSLPGMDGWEATRVLKADPATRDIVVIAVTGHAEPAYRARALEVGCDLVLTKPSLPSEITKHIIELLDAKARWGASR